GGKGHDQRNRAGRIIFTYRRHGHGRNRRCDGGRADKSQMCPHILTSLTLLLRAYGYRQSRRVASIDGEVPADNAVVAAAPAGGPTARDARLTDNGGTAAADLHRPIPAATRG